MTATHTPGPWRVEQETTGIWGACDPSDNSTRGMGYPIAECRTTPSGRWASGPDYDEAEANARLIAAAPDLLAALEHILAGALSLPRFAEDEARAAIAKATS